MINNKLDRRTLIIFIITIVLLIIILLWLFEVMQIFIIINLLLLLFTFVAILIKPTIGFYLIIITIPFDVYHVDLSYIYLSAANASILVTLFSLMLRFFLRKFKFILDKFTILFFFIFVAGVFSTLNAHPLDSHIRSLATLIGCGMVYYLTINIVRNEALLKRSINILGSIALIMSALSVIQLIFLRHLRAPLFLGTTGEYIGSGGGSITRLRIPISYVILQDKNAYAFFLLAIVPAFVSFFLVNKEHKKRFAYFVSGLVGILAIVLSYSRGAWVGLAISLLFILFVLIKLWTKENWLVASIAIVLTIIVIWFLGMRGLTENIIVKTSNLNIGAVNIRLELWEASIEEILRNPVLGIGFGGFQAKYMYVSHNSFLQLMVALGILGTLPFIIIVIKTLQRAAKQFQNKYVLSLTASLIGLITASIFIDVFFAKVLWLIIGLVNASCNIAENEYEKNSMVVHATQR